MSETTEGLTLGAVSDIVKTRILVDKVQIFQPGPEVLDPDSGEYVPGPDTIIFDGDGAVFALGGPGITLSLEGQAYADDTSSRFKLLTALDAPLASRGDLVRVTVATLDPGLLNREWRVLDISDANSLAVVRTTWLDQNTQTASTS
jgi:hypothetical protein